MADIPDAAAARAAVTQPPAELTAERQSKCELGVCCGCGRATDYDDEHGDYDEHCGYCYDRMAARYRDHQEFVHYHRDDAEVTQN